MLSTVAHFLLTNGIGQNLTAAVIIAVPSALWAHLAILRPWRAHRDRVAQLHEHALRTSSPSSHQAQR